MAARIGDEAKAFFALINTYLRTRQRILVQRAFSFARQAHGTQRRKSGELFFIHPIKVASYLAEYHLDGEALAAALLHDVAEDTVVSIQRIEAEFGMEVARLVDGVTKLKDVTEGIAKGRQLTREELQDATLIKMFGVMTLDERTIIIKIFDRLHNMRTIFALPRHKQEQKAKETLLVYAPLANRLGIWQVKNELESLSLAVLQNKTYHLIKQRLDEIYQEHLITYHDISGEIYQILLQADIDVSNVMLAPENVYTVYQDLMGKGASFHDIDRTIRLVVMVNDWLECYQAMGILHQLWRPIPGLFDDYIAVPRDNLYRSLHTTVIHTSGQRLKLRFRTPVMDKVSEIGVLAKWLYVGTTNFWTKGTAQRIDTFFNNINENIRAEPQNPTLGVKGVVEDVFRKQIHVYTPQGDVVELVEGATPIDFAYRIHTELGNQCYSAEVNEVSVALNKPLRDGDRVSITKRSSAQPHRAWLDEDLGYITTTYARSHARRWFRRLPEKVAISQGKALLQQELYMLGYPDFAHEQVVALLNQKTITTLYYSLGKAEILPTTLATRILKSKWHEGQSHTLSNVVFSESGEQFAIANAHGHDLSLCKSCKPRPPDSISGFIRADSRVTVHAESCHLFNPNRLSGRIIKLHWGELAENDLKVLTVCVDVYDRYGLLFEVTQLVKDEQINIAAINTYTPRKGEVRMVFSMEVIEPRQLVRILHQIRALANVYAVHCIHNDSANDEDDDSDASLKTYYFD